MNSVSGNRSSHFPEPEVLSAFACFDPNYLPLNRNCGVDQIKQLVETFGSVVGEADKVLNDWPSFVEHMVTTAPKDCENAASLCSILCRDLFLSHKISKNSLHCSNWLTVPLPAAWSERGFSFFKRTRTSHFNWILNENLSALLNISINYALVSDAKWAQLDAQKWLWRDERRTISKRDTKNLRAPIAAGWARKHTCPACRRREH